MGEETFFSKLPTIGKPEKSLKSFLAKCSRKKGASEIQVRALVNEDAVWTSKQEDSADCEDIYHR